MEESTAEGTAGPPTEETDPESPARTGSDGDTAASDAASSESTADGGPEPGATTGDDLVARLVPSWGRADADVVVKVYVVTGRHGGITIPERFCRECHMFVRAADAAAERVDAEVEVRVASWYTHVLGALRHGGYHPPVMVVDGERLCQGYDVPTPDEVVEAIERATGE